LNSVLSFDYPQELINLIVSDGSQHDHGVESRLIKILQEKQSSIGFQYLKNKKSTTPIGLNLAIKKGKNPIVIRLDAHSLYPKNYITSLVNKLCEDVEIGNVGCPVKSSSRKETIINKAICNTLGEGVGVGGSDFRTIQNKEIETDTVPFGCFRRDIFNEVGLFNEDLDRNQDIELNYRIKKNGKKIVLLSSPIIDYYPEEELSTFIKKAFSNGYWNGKTCLITSFRVLKNRHFIPAIFVFTLLISFLLSLLGINFGLFTFLAVTFSYTLFLSIGLSKLNCNFFEKIMTFVVIVLFHQSYGLGFLSCFIKIKNYCYIK